jgi:putative FmdB family regulatory protein
MALYEYRCGDDGPFDIIAPLGEAPATAPCPVCRAQGRRVYSSPMLTTMPRGLVAALDHEQKTRESPDVVTSLPPSRGHRRTPMAPLTPGVLGLPRP